ncbi:MAG: uroporphyrinogen-III synthase, partial [Deltaproteobacteria bacterium]
VRGEADVAVFTNGAQVEHLFRAAADEVALRAGLGRTVVASVGPVCSEVLEAHGVHPDLEASPPKMGPLVALIAERARAVLAVKRA